MIELSKWSRFKRSIAKIFLGTCILILLFWGITVWRTAQLDKVGRDLTPQSVVQIFESAGIEVSDLTDDVYYPTGYSGKSGLAFTSTIQSGKYHILVALYKDRTEAQHVTDGVNGLNRSMNGGHATAFNYGPIFVEVFPSDEDVADRLHRILKEIN